MSVSSLARQRIEGVLDDISFVEIGADVRARATDFGLSGEDAPTDGVITGYGLIGSRLVYIYSQDASVLGGSVGEMHAKKVARLYDLAMKTGAPVIGLIDSTGMRLQESTDAMRALSDISECQTRASGVIPQISVVYGGCGGALALIASLTDIVIMEEQKGRFFVNPPDAVDGNYKEKCDTSAAAFRSSMTPDIDLVCDDGSLAECVRTIVSLLPSNNEDDDAGMACTDDLNRLTAGVDALCKDPAGALKEISDSASFIELKKDFAPEMVTGLMRLNGETVGVIANRTEREGEKGKETFAPRLTARGAEKASRFVRFLDAFSIPLLIMTNVEGFAATAADESFAAYHAASLTYALSDATIAKVSLITGKAYGSAAIAMQAVGSGADFKICFPNAEIGTMDAANAAKILGDGKDKDEVKEIEARYRSLQNSAASAAHRGYVDEIVAPENVRKYLIGAFEMLYAKREDRPAKKHGAV